jgi:tRNA (guanine-N7-)-methyltransferase
MMDGAIERGRFFGRSKGKTIRQGQKAVLMEGLARLSVTLPAATAATGSETIVGGLRAEIGFHEPTLESLELVFGQRMSAYRLEIGFGGGEHLVHRALENPDAGFIGVEPFVNGMAKLLVEVDRRQIANIRVFASDATLLLRRLPAGALDEVCLLYPDPWPKRRQRKRRFVAAESLALIARALKPGGLFRFASDIDDYVGWALVRALASPDFEWPVRASADWTEAYPGWPGTRYEAKAFREGRRPSYLTFVRR